VNPTAGLDAVEYRKISCPCQDMKPGHPVLSSSLRATWVRIAGVPTENGTSQIEVTSITVTPTSGFMNMNSDGCNMYRMIEREDAEVNNKGKGKAIPVTGRGGPLACETLRFPHFLDNRLTDGGEVVSPTR
jgi:hypothetical protein